jgi:hypothetical protein
MLSKFDRDRFTGFIAIAEAKFRLEKKKKKNEKKKK